MRNLRAAAAAVLLAAASAGPAIGQVVLHKVELHPGQKADVCIGPTSRGGEVFADLATVRCDRDWSVFTFVAVPSEPSWDPVQRAGLLVHDRTGLCVASQDGSDKAGTPLVLDDCGGRDSQRWVLSGPEIVNARSRLCVGTASGAATVGASLVQAACAKQEGQVFSQSRTVAPRQLAAANRPIGMRGAPPAGAGVPPQMAGMQGLQTCSLPSAMLADQLMNLPPGAAEATAGACLGQRHAGRLLRAGFHTFYVNKTGQKQRIDAGRLADCGFQPRDLVNVEPEILAAIPTGEPMPAEPAACTKARSG